MVWTVKISPDAAQDLSLIANFLYHTYVGFGDAPEDAYTRMTDRIRGIEQSAYDLAKNPYCGTKHPDMGVNIRNVTIRNAIIWFQINKGTETVFILGFFFGGQDHIGQMLERLL